MTKQELRDIWMKYAEEHKDILDGRVKENIEKYRKGDCKLCFKDKDGNPLVGKTVKINQTSHDFKYGANIFMLDEFEDDPKKIWESNIFGKSLHELVNEGLHNKLYRMPDDAQMKLQETLQKIINEGSGGLICIIL